MARPAMGVRWGGEACAAAQPAAGRRQQAVPPALVSAARARRVEIEEARRPLDGHPTVAACASTFFLGKHTSQPIVGAQVSLKFVENNIQPICHYF